MNAVSHVKKTEDDYQERYHVTEGKKKYVIKFSRGKAIPAVIVTCAHSAKKQMMAQMVMFQVQKNLYYFCYG
jgi:hypothetical protein